jgi:hypothetical protein
MGMLLVMSACEPKPKKKKGKEDSFDLPEVRVSLKSGIYFSEGECNKVFKKHGVNRSTMFYYLGVHGIYSDEGEQPERSIGQLQLDILHLKQSGEDMTLQDVGGPYGVPSDFSLLWKEDQSMYLEVIDLRDATDEFRLGVYKEDIIEGVYELNIGCKVKGGYTVEYIIIGVITKDCSLVLDVHYTPKRHWLNASECPGAAAYEFPIETEFPSFCVYLPGVYSTANYSSPEGIFIEKYTFMTPFEVTPSDAAVIQPAELNKILKREYGCEIPMR